MTPEILFDQIVAHYERSKDIIEQYQHTQIYRDRQHTISSILEDLFAHYIQKYLSEKFRGLDLVFMIDYSILIGKEKMIPDIAIIIDGSHPVLASYIDIKTDLGYKRNYYTQFESIQKKVYKLRNSNFNGLVGKCGKNISVSSNLKWRTIVISDRNISAALLLSNKENAEKLNNAFNLYFLSSDSHPNSKKRNLIKINESVFTALLHDIEDDIRLALIVPSLESLL
jgi:hypothetical protein